MQISIDNYRVAWSFLVTPFWMISGYVSRTETEATRINATIRLGYNDAKPSKAHVYLQTRLGMLTFDIEEALIPF